ncbi:MAG: FtsW/RodA/SpoVE family cell cycle protein [Lachnospiraceae bacterium]|nr:FtsW/RodA/SpoVE family cell cycle protein [Lachnospiraceae bacterium]
MQHYIVELSKYAIAFIMCLYTFESFFVFRHDNELDRTGSYIRQCIYMFLITLLSFASLTLQRGEIEYIFFFAFLEIALFSVIVLFSMIYPLCNRLLVNHMCMLLSIGFIMIARLDFSKAIKQFVIVAVSLVIALIVPFFVHNLRFLKHLWFLYATIGIGGLGAVLLAGQVTHGSKIFYSIQGVTIQPSEFIKIIYAFLIASLLYKSTKITQVLLSAFLAAIHVLILVASRDLGSAVIFFIGYLFVLFIASRNYLYLFSGIGIGSIAAVVSYYLFSHVQVRVQAFLDPFAAIDKEGYQITQSLFAIGTGSWFGMGLNRGTPNDIPYVLSDFMFSAVAEEMGVIFAICMILVCLSCFVMMMTIALSLQERFYQLIAVGLGVIYIFQIFLTIGGGIKFIPMTGVTLPLVSYGGSSVLSTLLMFSVVQGLYIVRKDEQKQEEEEELEEEEFLYANKKRQKRKRLNF